MKGIPEEELSIIETLIAKGQFTRAVKSLEELAIANPRNPRVWKNLGVANRYLKNFEQAEKHFLHSIDLDEKDVDTYCSLGGLYLSLSEFEKSINYIEKGLFLSKNKNTFALLNYLVLKSRESKPHDILIRFNDALKESESKCREHIDSGENFPWAFFDLALIYFFRGNLNHCKDTIKEAVRMSSGSWQLNSANFTYKLLTESQDDGTSTSAQEVVHLIEKLKDEYFTETEKKTCFVIMPFGNKLDENDLEVNFDEVYYNFIKPIVESLGLQCIRCDEVDEAGNIQKKMFQMIWSSDVAIVDVSIPNPNVFYELGIRHSLRKSVTVIIRNKNATLPFNIANMNAILYNFVSGKGDDLAQTRIQNAISTGLSLGKSDSIVNEVLDLNITDRPIIVGSSNIYSYPIKDTGKKLSLITGDIRNIRGIDVWMNSENTNMQMARNFDFAISSVIRFEGAKKNRAGHVTEDVIQNELNIIMEGERSVPEAEVIVTGSGELSKKNGVKAIFHAASVRGTIGAGYEPIPNIHRCVTNALELMDDPDKNGVGTKLNSILIPLIGIGYTRGDFRPLLQRQVESAIGYIINNPMSDVQNIYFLAWSEQEVSLCQSVFRSFESLGLPIKIK